MMIDWKETAFEFAIEIYKYAWSQAVRNESLFKTFNEDDMEILVETFGYEYVKEKLCEAVDEKNRCEEIEKPCQ